MLVRQEVESGEETAINSETFGLISRLLYLSHKCDMFSCFLQFMALVNNPSIAGVRGSPKIPAGSVQESQPVFVLRPFIVSSSAVFNLIRTSSKMLKLSFAERESISPPDLPADKENSSLSQLLRPPARRSAHLETANSLHLDFKNTHFNDNLLEHLNL